MSEKQKPPPSISHILEEGARGERLADLLERKSRETLQAVDVSFEDEFAPSSSPEKEVNNTGVLQTKPGRLTCYNDHVIDYMEGALDRACDLGAPRLPWLFPLQFPPVDEALFRNIAPLVGQLSENLEEQSDDWLALKCYLCWLQACHALSEDAPVLYVAERMFIAGATAREFELSVRNRRHSALGRKQNRHLTELRKSKNRRAATNVERRRQAVASLLPETRLTGGALDSWLVRKLLQRHDIRVSSRTVRSDRKALRD